MAERIPTPVYTADTDGMTKCCRFKKECEKVWKEAQQLSMAESSQASVSGERHSGDALSSEVDISAAAKACRNSEVPRR